MFGMPGAGKGTQANFLHKEYNIPHISTGQIFRDEMVKKSELGLKIDSLMRQGRFVDDETTIQVIQHVMEENNEWIFDGFPRNEYQAEWFDTYCQKENIKLDGLFFLDIDKQEAIKRIEKRAKQIDRPEDVSQESIKNRFNIFYNDTLPGINYFINKNMITIIDGTQQQKIIQSLIIGAINGRHL